MGYTPMTDEEWHAFLGAPVRPAILATVRPDGRPHAAPVWYDLDGTTAHAPVVFTTGRDTVKGRNLAHDPRVTLCVQDPDPPFSFVTVEGIAEVSDDLERVGYWAGRIGGRYMGAHRTDEYGSRNAVPGELLVQVAPLHVVAKKNVAD